jgi:UDP-N-acetylglucosamine 2-epimerase (non-hydrolysing)
MKAAPLFMEIKKYKGITPLLIHTGQHYDKNLSKIFFDDLKLPRPRFELGVGSGSHSKQTALIMIEFEKILVKQNPHLIMVVGDVNSTLACALATAKYRCLNQEYRPLIAHVEAGLRSFDWKMPEEINRRLTDSLSDLLFTTEPKARENLIREGIERKKIFYVGNVMIDSLLKFKKRAEGSDLLSRMKLEEKSYALLTMHRPTNVDERESLTLILNTLKEVSIYIPIVFPIHPRTKKQFRRYHINSKFLRIIPALGYLDFLKLMMGAKFVLTDSGGIQEETTVLGIPCLTIRENTERPVTVSEGTNTIVGANHLRIVEEVKKILGGKEKRGTIPRLWDGKTAERICKIVWEKIQSGKR